MSFLPEPSVSQCCSFCSEVLGVGTSAPALRHDSLSFASTSALSCERVCVSAPRVSVTAAEGRECVGECF